MKKLISVAAVLAMAAIVSPRRAMAGPIISTINGYYDVDGGDTASLHISNSTAFDFTSVVLKLTGYQGLNNGLVQSVNLPDITAGTTDILVWGNISGVDNSLSPHNLFAVDYDDSYVNAFAPQTGFGLVSQNPDTLVAAPQCAPQANIYGWQYCADVGNFYVTFTAMWNGEAIYSQFSPDPNLPGAGNAAGVFVGWEGLDQNGWAETDFDSHSSGGPNGTLANILAGTPPVVGVPEPASLPLLGSGLLVLIAALRRRIRPVS